MFQIDLASWWIGKGRSTAGDHWNYNLILDLSWCGNYLRVLFDQNYLFRAISSSAVINSKNLYPTGRVLATQCTRRCFCWKTRESVDFHSLENEVVMGARKVRF